jgi:hypothetical protein
VPPREQLRFGGHTIGIDEHTLVANDEMLGRRVPIAGPEVDECKERRARQGCEQRLCCDPAPTRRPRASTGIGVRNKFLIMWNFVD